MAKGRHIVRALVDVAGLVCPPRRQAATEAEANTVQSQQRILIFNWRDMRHAQAGGAERYIHEIARRWVREGHQVTMFSGHSGNDALREEVVDGIHTIRRGGFWLVYLWAFLYYVFRFRRRYDVIVDCHNGIPFFTPLFAREPVVCIVHHVHQEVFKRHLAKPLAAFACFLEAKLMPRAYNQSRMVAVSPSTRDDMHELLGIDRRGVEIVYNGVDGVNLKPGHKASQPTVVFLGRLQAYKSVDVLIRAFSKVRQAIPNARLVIAGSGEEEAALKKLARRKKLHDAVEFAGFVSEDRKIELMQQAWVAANPSMMEGWGVTTIEANACATPVVGSDVPGLRDSIRHEDTGFLVSYGDASELAQSLTAVLKNEQLRYTVSMRAHRWSKRFRWDRSAQDLMRIMRGGVRPGDVPDVSVEQMDTA